MTFGRYRQILVEEGYPAWWAMATYPTLDPEWSEESIRKSIILMKPDFMEVLEKATNGTRQEFSKAYDEFMKRRRREIN